MSLPVSSAKAQNVHYGSLPAFAASTTSSASCLLVAVVFFGVFFPNKSFKPIFLLRWVILDRLDSCDTVLSLIRRVVSMSSPDIASTAGIEAAMFDCFMGCWVVALLGLSVLIIPTVAVFNSLAVPDNNSTDTLHKLDWTRLDPHEPLPYWFYAGLVPVTTCVVLVVLTKQFGVALRLQARLMGYKYRDGIKYRVLLIWRSGSQETINEILQRLNLQFRAFKTFDTQPPNLLRQNDKMLELRARIEQSELEFILSMLKLSTTAQEDEFSHVLQDRVRKRYSPAASSKISHLYQEFRLHFTHSHRHYRAMCVTTRDQRASAYAVDWLNSHLKDGRAHSLGTDDLIVGAPDGINMWPWSHFLKASINTGLAMTTLLWTIPLSCCGMLAQLDALLALVPSRAHFRIPQGLLAVLQGILPSAMTSILMSLYVPCLQLLVGLQPHFTRTEAEVAFQWHYLVFLFLQLFLTTSISSGCLPIVKAAIDRGVADVPILIAQNLPLASDYFLSYFLIQSFGTAASTLLRWRPLGQMVLNRRRTIWTPREKAGHLHTLLAAVRWSEVYPLYSVLAIIAVTYSNMAPLILPTALIAFGLTRLTYRYIIICTSYTPHDTDGALCLSAMFTAFLGLYTFQVFSLGLFLLKLSAGRTSQNVGQVLMIVATMYCTVQYHLLCSSDFRALAWMDSESLLERHDTLTGDFGRLGSSPTSTLEPRDLTNLVWIPRDSTGVSQAMISVIQELHNASIITDTGATINWDGHVCIE